MTGSAKMTTRSSNFELLRIISMLLIVASHYAYHGIWQFGTVNEGLWKTALFAKKLFTCFLEQGEVGVACFFMISGYFLIQKKSARLSRILVQTVLWSWVAGILSVMFTIHGGGV